MWKKNIEKPRGLVKKKNYGGVELGAFGTESEGSGHECIWHSYRGGARRRVQERILTFSNKLRLKSRVKLSHVDGILCQLKAWHIVGEQMAE